MALASQRADIERTLWKRILDTSGLDGAAVPSMEELIAEHCVPGIKLDEDAVMGRKLVATRPFGAGAELIREPATAFFVEDSTGTVRTLREFQDTWFPRPSLSPEAAYHRLLLLRAEGRVEHPTDEYLAGVMASDAARPPNQRVAPRAFVMFKLAQSNAFGVWMPPAAVDDLRATTGVRIPRDVSSGTTSGSTSSRSLSAFFPVAAMMNSNCEPNILVHAAWDAELHCPVAVVTAARPIGAGEELWNCYADPHAALPERQAKLKKFYAFTCKCQRCRQELLASLPAVRKHVSTTATTAAAATTATTAAASGGSGSGTSPADASPAVEDSR